MKFNALMHVNIRVKDWDKMVDFYQNKLGLKVKVIVKYKEYLHSDNRPAEKEIAQKAPEKVMYGYFEITPGQFIEMSLADDSEIDDVTWNSRLGLNHFALTVNDIQKTYQEFKARIFQYSVNQVRDQLERGSFGVMIPRIIILK